MTHCNVQDLVTELENERTNRVIAQQTANQERLQARASAAESASLRRQLNELTQQMEQERRAASRLQEQQPSSAQPSQVCQATCHAGTCSFFPNMLADARIRVIKHLDPSTKL